MGKTTVEEKVKNKLPHISKEKSDKVTEIIKSHTSTKAEQDEQIRERTLLETELFLRGYTLSQVAYLVNSSYTTTQRDLSNRLSLIDKEKSKQVEEIMNKEKNFSEDVKERTLLEYELLMRGYSLKQAAYLVNGSYSTIQRDLKDKLPLISKEKGEKAKIKLKENKYKLSGKHWD